MYKTIDIKEKAAMLEMEIRKYWEKENLSEKSISFRKGAPQYIFFEGPPTANGKPGIHHMMSRTIKDTVCRYKTMSGFQVKRKAGWDTHGLPVEIEVGKKLGLKDKKAIQDYGMEEFNKQCKRSVFSYEKEWRDMTRQMGYWIDLEHPYITLENNYIETIWWILNQFFLKDLIYKGDKITPYCPSCGTTLSSHEVAQGYKDTEDPSVFVKFKSLEEENTYFLAWTTTPWTLISNVALVVHPKEIYVKVVHNEENIILAKSRLSILDSNYEIIEEYLGKELEYKKYDQLFKFVKTDKKCFFIACADYVTMDDGTGIVHTAPAFGQDDFALGVKYNLPMIQPVDATGKFTKEVTDWAGVFVKDADKSIIKKLKERNLLFKRMQIMHSYPFCWRCQSPLLYYARSSWYIRTSLFKEEMLKNNESINWQPPFVGEKRLGRWLENNVDWNLSRERFWGTPLNIWVCPDCNHKESVGSIAELREKGIMKEGIDQTRGWFYTLLAISTMLKGKAPFKNVLVNDLILDKKGQKMSKSKGNALDPFKLMEEFGADTNRWYMLYVSPPWVPTKFDPKGVTEVANKFFGTLKNVYSFYTSYANINDFMASNYEISDDKKTEIDKWVISRLNSLIKDVTKNMDSYDLTKSVRAIQNFVINDLSNWFVRRSRRRFWAMTLTEDKKEAYLTLYQTLVTVSKLMSPFAPYLSEEMYINLTGEKSVHLTDFPKTNEAVINKKLEQEMEAVINMVSLGRAARNSCQIKVRQTLQALYVPEKYKYLVERMEELIKDEINVKEIKYIHEKDHFVEYEVKANFKMLGPKYGKHMKKIANALKKIQANNLMTAFHKDEPYYLDCDGSSFKITEEDLIVSIKDKEGFVFESSNDLYVALDTELTSELVIEGYARELVNKIQFTRKENNFEIMDNIKVFYYGDDEIESVFNKFEEYIKNETLTNKIYREESLKNDMKEWDINGKVVHLTIAKL